MNRLLACLFLSILCGGAASAQPVSFRGKTVSMIVGYSAGGGTDLTGRLIASVLGRHLPGEPLVVTQNIPGGDGIAALNYFVQQVKPDGLTLTIGSGSQADPTHYRKPQAHFDPTSFVFVGGAGRGGSALVIRAGAEKQLSTIDGPAVIMGTTGGAPRVYMQMAAWGKEFLGWNLRWVLGYRGTNQLFVALDRGEIDMTATSNITLFAPLVAAGRTRILVQSGAMKDGELMPRPEFGGAPIMSTLLKDRITDPIAAKGFDYWLTVHAGPDKWLALPPGTPDVIAQAYREAFARAVNDPEFIARSRQLAEDITPASYRDVERWMKSQGQTPPEALDFIAGMLRRQGVKID